MSLNFILVSNCLGVLSMFGEGGWGAYLIFRFSLIHANLVMCQYLPLTLNDIKYPCKTGLIYYDDWDTKHIIHPVVFMYLLDT